MRQLTTLLIIVSSFISFTIHLQAQSYSFYRPPFDKLQFDSLLVIDPDHDANGEMKDSSRLHIIRDTENNTCTELVLSYEDEEGNYRDVGWYEAGKRVMYFNDTDSLIKWEGYRDTDEVDVWIKTEEVEIYYDENKNLLKELRRVFSWDGLDTTSLQKIEYINDLTTNRNMVKYNYYWDYDSSSWVLNSVHMKKYTENGAISEHAVDEMQNDATWRRTVIMYTYDDDGNKTQTHTRRWETLNQNDTPFNDYKSEYYFSDGYLMYETSLVMHDGEHKLQSSHSYKYDEEGRMLEDQYVLFELGGPLKTGTKIFYAYNKDKTINTLEQTSLEYDSDDNDYYKSKVVVTEENEDLFTRDIYITYYEKDGNVKREEKSEGRYNPNYFDHYAIYASLSYKNIETNEWSETRRTFAYYTLHVVGLEIDGDNNVVIEFDQKLVDTDNLVDNLVVEVVDELKTNNDIYVENAYVDPSNEYKLVIELNRALKDGEKINVSMKDGYKSQDGVNVNFSLTAANDKATALSSGAESGVEVYPSIATDIVTLKSDDEITSVSLFDNNGKLVELFKNSTNEAQISVKNFPVGLYRVIGATQSSSFNKTFVVGNK